MNRWLCDLRPASGAESGAAGLTSRSTAGTISLIDTIACPRSAILVGACNVYSLAGKNDGGMTVRAWKACCVKSDAETPLRLAEQLRGQRPRHRAVLTHRLLVEPRDRGARAREGSL